MISYAYQVFSQVIVFAVLWSYGSFLIHPYLSRDLCITDNRFSTRMASFDKVIAAFNERGITMKKSCEDWTAIEISYDAVENAQVIAQTLPYGFSPTFVDTNKEGVQEEEYQVFLPWVSPYVRTMQFSTAFLTLPDHEFELVVIHEMGHALGAPHIYRNSFHIMSPEITYTTQSLDSAVMQVKGLTNWLNRY